MRVYKVHIVPDNHECLTNVGDIDPFEDLCGQPRKATWKSVKVKRFVSSEKPSLKKSDPDIWQKLPDIAFGPRAVEALCPVIGPFVELLPITLDKQTLFYVNVINIVDGLNLERSNILYDDVSGHIRYIDVFAFKPEKVKDQLIFKLPQRPDAYTFVTQPFVDLCERAKLLTPVFKLVWDSEAPLPQLKTAPAIPPRSPAIPTTEQALSDEHRSEFQKEFARWCKFTGMLPQADPKTIALRVQEEILRARMSKSPLKQDRSIDLAMMFGAAWANAVQRSTRWEFVNLTRGGREMLALVSPDRAHACPVLQVLLRQLQQPELEETSLLLFNMICAGELNPSSPGSYRLIM